MTRSATKPLALGLTCLMAVACGRFQEPTTEATGIAVVDFENPPPDPLLIEGEYPFCGSGSVAQAPAAFEFETFRQRSVRNAVTDPINIRCIRRHYSDAAIARWAAAGDPVAMYASVAARYPQLRPACADRLAIERELYRVLETKVVLQSGRSISRVPEAFWVIGSLRAKCGERDNEQFINGSYEAGFDPSELATGRE